MRRVSKRRAALNAQVREWRDALRARVGRCEVCLKPAEPAWLDVHELVPAYCRSLALDKEFATLCATRLCHTYLETLTIPNQLAYLYIARSTEFDLDKYHDLIKRRWPDWEEVSAYVDQILTLKTQGR